jgi:CBS domain containing-hemolysin-like protein
VVFNANALHEMPIDDGGGTPGAYPACMALLIVFGVLAVGVSFLCSLLEAALLSLPRSYVESLAEQGSGVGARLRKMKDEIDRPLAAILTLNTVAHTVGAAGVGAQSATVFGDAAVGIASAVMTLLVLVFSEIIPKTLGAMHAKALAGFTAVSVRVLILVCLPIIVPLEWVNRLVARPTGESSISRAELIATIRLGQSSGVLREREHRVAQNLMALSSIRLREVMTPRTVIFSLPVDATVGEVMSRHHPIRFARIPVRAPDGERIVGYVARFAISEAHFRGELGTPVGDLVQEMPALPQAGTVVDGLDLLMRGGWHIAQVVDEYGGFSGIVTLEDLIETLLGDEIVDETDTVADMRELARRRRAQDSTG